ncbi:transposase [Micromonospora echinospora]|uniref:transposase n=1 Tax=Micromonospora echinospora TaxID=1877 RepID=UPI0033DFCD80
MTQRILTELRERARLAHDRQPELTAGVIDPQGVRAADTAHHDSRGYDCGKKVNGRKRLIVTDMLGLLVTVWVLAAPWQDRDGAKGALLAAYAGTPSRHVFADSGFASRLVEWARDTLEIVRKPADQQGSVVHPAAGSSSGPWPGSPPTAASPATTKPAPPPQKTWSAGPPSAARSAASPGTGPPPANNAAPSTHPTDRHVKRLLTHRSRQEPPSL